MAFTYRNPERSTDPHRVLPSARSIIVGARSYLADAEPSAPTPTSARVARYAWADHYGELRDGLQVLAARLKDSGEKAVVLADDNSIVDREVAYRAGLGWFGKNANLLLSRCGQLLRARVHRHHAPSSPPPNRSPTAAGRAGVASTAAPRARSSPPASIDANRCLAWILQQPGLDPDRVPRGASATGSTAATTARTSARRRCRLGRRASAPARRRREAWVDVLDLLDADDETLLERHGRWYIAEPRPALVAAQRARRARQRRRRRDRTAVPAIARPLPHGARPDPRRDTRRGLWRRSPAPRRSSPLASAAREAPARHERLPTQDRRHPVAALGVVAAPAARLVRRPHQPVRRAPRSSTPRSRSASSAPASRCCCRTR